MEDDIYEHIPYEIKEQLELICLYDPYGLNPRTLFYNIYSSSGSYEKLAKIYDVPLSLVRRIKELEGP